jgi:hypothetical protein
MEEEAGSPSKGETIGKGRRGGTKREEEGGGGGGGATAAAKGGGDGVAVQVILVSSNYFSCLVYDLNRGSMYGCVFIFGWCRKAFLNLLPPLTTYREPLPTRR